MTYPVPEEMLDIIRNYLKPRGIEPKRRTAELTVAILQLVASRRGIAAMPNWAVQSYLQTGYVQGKRIGKNGLFGELYAVTLPETAQAAYMQDFLETVRTVSFN
jgi:LysR family transcriptional regulator, regulator for metE and metH